MEDLINEIQERTGLSAEKVLEVVTMVTDYMKNVLPDDLIQQVTRYLSDAAVTPGDSAGNVVSTAADFAAKAAETGAAAFGSVVSAVSDMIPKTNDE